MDFVFSKHAEEQLLRRGLDKETVVSVILRPDEIVIDEDNPEISIYQSVIKAGEQLFLLRVFMNRVKHPPMVVTLYKTTKIKKYYEGKI